VGPGGYYQIPTHVPHTVQAGAEDTHAILVSSPAGFAELVARAGTPPTSPPRRPNPTWSCSWPSAPSSVTSHSALLG
jgi:hypothetical protein